MAKTIEELSSSVAIIMDGWYKAGYSPGDVLFILTLIFTTHYKLITDPPPLQDALNLFCDVVRADFESHPETH